MSVMPAPPERHDAPGFVLRRWTPADVALLQAAIDANEAHLREFTPFVVTGKVPGLTLEERIVRHVADWDGGTEWLYGVFTPDETTVIGGCGLHPRIGPEAVEIGYWLAAHMTGRGIATTIARTLTDTAFAPAHMQRVEIRVEPRNMRSAMVPQRLGFEVTGIADVTGFTLEVWTMTRERWIARRA